MTVELKDGSVVIDGRPEFLMGGEFTPYRLAPELWRDRIEKLKAGGLNTLSIYWAWNFYSKENGQVDFDSPERNIDELLKIAKDAGMYVIARPGPYVCNEWDLGGYPSWLLKEDSGDWRTADPKHLAFCREWFKQINPIIKKHEHTRGGSVVLYQIDNEHRWNDPKFLPALCDMAREDGITVPLVGNHDGGSNVAQDKMLDACDIYTPPFEFYRWRSWLEAEHRRIGLDKPLMVMEYACGSVALWGDAPPNNEWPPPHWTISQTRLFMATGANVLNYFVGAGGTTPVGFNSDHITTSYVENAPVSPSGELTPRFYEMRLLGEFIKSFSSEIALSRQKNGGWGTDHFQIERLTRVGPAGTFFVLINHAATPEKFQVQLDDGSKLPPRGKMSIDPLRTQVLVADADLGDGLRLKFCSLQIMKKWTEGSTTRLVVYGTPGEAGWLIVEGGGKTESIDFKVSDDVISRSLKLGAREVEVFIAPRVIAERTWFVPAAKGIAPVFSNLDLVRDGGRAEIRADETVRVTVPASVKRVKIDGKDIELQAKGDRLCGSTVSLKKLNPPTITMSQPQARAESNWSAELDAKGDWREAKPWGDGAEVLASPGDYQWKTSFDVSGELPDKIEFLSINTSEITVWLNGKRLGTHPKVRLPQTHHLQSFNAFFDVAGIVKSGRNDLAVNVHFHGRHNTGQPIFAGIAKPVVLRRGERKEWPLPKWHVSPVSRQRWLADELTNAKVPAISEMQDVDLSKPNTHRSQISTEFWREARFYRANISVPKELRGKPLFLDCPAVEETWAYVDGKCIGRTRAGESSCVDLTPYSNRETIDVAIAVRHVCFGHGGYIGFASPPKLITADQALDGKWFIRQGSEGSREKWASKKDGWKSLGEISPSERAWFRIPVRVSLTKGIASPVFVELQDFETNATLWWNGESIGLWGTIGPQRRFFVDDGKVKNENELVIEVDGYGKPAKFGKVDVGFYYQAQEFQIEIK